MIRLLAAVAALLLTSGAARAQQKEETPAKPAELDPKTRALVREEVEKAKEEIRNEVRAEMQGAQAAAEFLGAVAEGPKLEFLEVDGYLRFRGDMFDDFALGRPADAAGYLIFPTPARARSDHGTLATANMRFRFEPTLNVSEYARVRAQIDVLDNYVLGSSPGPLYDFPGSPYPVPFYGSNRVLAPNDRTADRDAILPKRAWAEVQTPVGLLSFGRMPSHWGLGILTNDGSGLDQDYGDTVDRLQFAIAPVTTPLGKLAIVPILDFDAEGVLQRDQQNPSSGQPFDLDSGDDARTFALKIARVDTDDEIRRKLERNESSVNFGLYYGYRTNPWYSPAWYELGGLAPPFDDAGNQLWIKRSAFAHYLDFWTRVRTSRMRIELELVGVYGSMGDPRTNIPDDPILGTTAPHKIELRQWGGALQFEYQAKPNKLALGAEVGAASGDSAPGFGNQPNRLTVSATPALPDYGTMEGPQWDANDHSIRNFRFNPAYRIDLIGWREIIGQVTDAWYVRSNGRWTFLPGLALDVAVIYSQALFGESTPSADAPRGSSNPGGSRPLAAELDTVLNFDSGTGFVAWLGFGILQPLGGVDPPTGPTARAATFRTGLAVKF